MDYIYAKLDNNLVDINRIEYIKLKKCDIEHQPVDSLEIGDYYLETRIVDSDKLIYTDLSDLNEDTNNVSSTLEQEIKDRIEEGIKLQTNIDNEAKRTDNMINQLNENVHSQLTQLNKILVDSINTINGGIEEERKIREQADNTLQSNLDKESKRVDSMINQVNANIKVIVDQLNKNIATIVGTINTNLDNESKERLKQDTILDNRITEEVATLNSTISTTKDELQTNIDAVDQDLQDKYEHAMESVSTSFDEIRQIIAEEIERATTAEQQINTNLSQEIQDRKDAITTLSHALDSEVARATAKETLLETNINNEKDRATTAETTLSSILTKEIADREKDVQTLTTNLNAEIKRSTDIDTQHSADLSTISNNLQIETNRASQAEGNLHTEFTEGIAQEKQERINSDNALSTRIDNLEGKTTRLYYGEGTLSSPTATEIQSFITNLEVDPPYAPPYSGIAVVVKLTDENTYHIWHYYSNLASWKDDGVDLVNTFTNNTRGIIQGTTSVGYISAVDGFGKINGWEELNSTVSNNYNTLNDKIDDSVSTINTTISSLSTRLDAKIDAVDDKLDQEINDRTEAINNLDTELSADINAEKTAREQADNTLTTSLNKEISDRKAADTNLTNTELRFTKSTGTTMAVGGIAKGTTFSNKKLMDIINEMLYPYVSFSISGFTLSPNNGGTFENGSSVTLTGSRTTINAGSENITNVTILDGQTTLGSLSSGLTGTSFSVPIDLTISTNKVLTTKVTDAHGTTLTRNSASFTFVYPFYYGSLNNGVYDETSVKGLTKLIQGKGSKKVTFTHNDKCCVFAYPASYGDIRSAIDQNNFDVTSAFTKHTINITGLDQKAVSYNVYTNSPATLDNFSITFNF